MAKLIILRGLPASGKSTWARSWCEDPANTWPHCVISLDDIRLMIAGSAQVRNRLQQCPCLLTGKQGHYATA